MKIFNDKEKYVDRILVDLKKNVEKNLENLPNEELPIMENHLRALYFETYFLLVLGFFNASLILCGVLLESLAKEKLHMAGISDEEIETFTLETTIKKC